MEEDGIQELPIGEVADAMGVTIRTIRHYEAVGLLGPAERSYGGHRRYGEGDVAQLRRIVILRRCGFGLEAIRRLLDTSSRDDALAVAKRGLERAEVELDVARRLHTRMRQFAGLLESSQDESIDKLIAEMETEKMNVNLDRISTGSATQAIPILPTARASQRSTLFSRQLAPPKSLGPRLAWPWPKRSCPIVTALGWSGWLTTSSTSAPISPRHPATATAVRGSVPSTSSGWKRRPPRPTKG